MKDFEQAHYCKSSEVSSKVPQLRDRGHIKGGDSPSSIFGQASFISKVAVHLSTNEIEYLKAMVTDVEGRFPTISTLRKTFVERGQIFPNGDPTTVSDVEILKKLFGFQSSIPMSNT